MFKKLAIFAVAALLTLSASSAFAAFGDLELIRVYYERTTGTAELVTDLGNVNTIIAGGGTVAGSFGTVGTPANMFAVYYAIDHVTQQLWVSGSMLSAPVAVGSPGFTTTKSATNLVAGYYNSLGTVVGTQYTASQSFANSYRLKLAASQGAIGNTVNIATRPNTEISLASILGGSGSVSQKLYFFSSPNTAGSLGVEMATIVTNWDGSTTITPMNNTPIPAAAWLLGSGLMGLVGLRRKFNV
jgi:hypothetical protein